jgi:hypothetical protein
MIELNDTNGASGVTQHYANRVMHEFAGPLAGAEFGVAYGGGVERIGKLWKNRGVVYGFDTFEGHPKQIGEICPFSSMAGGRSSFAATCMDNWYKPEHYGVEAITDKYIQAELDRQGLDNVKLVKGLVTADTDVSFLPELHYCLLDLDFPLSMLEAYRLVADKIVKGGYLLLHDVVPRGHILGCWEVYQRMLEEGKFMIVEEREDCLLAVLKRI